VLLNRRPFWVNVSVRWKMYNSHYGPPWAVELPGSSTMPVRSPMEFPATQRSTLKVPNAAAFEIDGHPSSAPVTGPATTESHYVVSPLTSSAGTGQMRTGWDVQTLQVPRPPMVAYHLVLYIHFPLTYCRCTKSPDRTQVRRARELRLVIRYQG
jgi:hypothetical protein